MCFYMYGYIIYSLYFIDYVYVDVYVYFYVYKCLCLCLIYSLLRFKIFDYEISNMLNFQYWQSKIRQFLPIFVYNGE